MKWLLVLMVLAGCDAQRLAGDWVLVDADGSSWKCGPDKLPPAGQSHWTFTTGPGYDEITPTNCPGLPLHVNGNVAELAAPGNCAEYSIFVDVHFSTLTLNDDPAHPSFQLVGDTGPGGCTVNEFGSAQRR